MVGSVAFGVDTVSRIWAFAVAGQDDCQRKQCIEKFLHYLLNIANKITVKAALYCIAAFTVNNI
jgi:hypothetical protein